MSDISDLPTKSGLSQLNEWQAFVDKLDSSQLHLLNDMVCARIDYLKASEIGRQMANFRPGDKVSFVDKKGVLVTGRVAKINRKTISVFGDIGGKWNVSPGLLSLVPQEEPSAKVSSLPSVEADEFQPEVDWVFSVVSLPGTIEIDDDYVALKAAIWMDGNGLVRHIRALDPEDETDQIFSSFEEAQSSIAAGPPRTPVHVRTDHVVLIEDFRSLYPEIQFTEGEVPEILDVAEEMRKSFSPDDLPSFSDLGISSEVAATFFEATATLYKSAPWNVLPSEHLLIGVSIRELGVESGVLSVIGQQGVNFAVLLFDSIEDHQLYTALVNNGPEGFARLPSHKALVFEQEDSVAPVARKEMMEQGWSIAGPNAYPELLLPVEGAIARHPTVDDLKLFEVLSRGMVTLLKHRKEIKTHWNTGKPFRCDDRVSVSDRKLDISFNLPATPGNKPVEKLNALEKMALLDRSNQSDRSDIHVELLKEMAAQFEVSKECQALKELSGGHTLIMELGFVYLNVTVASCVPVDLEEILYQLIPRKVMIAPKEAVGLVQDCRAFYKFLKRKYNHPFADECLAVLGSEATTKLSDVLGDTSKYGIGKSAVSDSQFPFGFDDNSINKMLLFNDELGGSKLEQGPLRPTAAKKKSRKKKRKASQKSRKQNRR